MNTISLHGAEFFAYHGWYPEEQKLGNRFIVDIDVDFIGEMTFSEDDIKGTINYEQLYEIVDEQMKQTKKLIETVARNILNDTKKKFPAAKNVQVSIKKLNPPLKGKVAYSCITVSEP
jgi:7,8-dihydroneopterin aldolase/epimerase/oxygenase